MFGGVNFIGVALLPKVVRILVAINPGMVLTSGVVYCVLCR